MNIRLERIVSELLQSQPITQDDQDYLTKLVLALQAGQEAKGQELPITMGEMDEAVAHLSGILSLEQRASLACVILPMASDFANVMSDINWSN